jgi:NADH-quinone oxidoreductase subunit C
MNTFEALFSLDTDAQLYYPIDVDISSEDPLDHDTYYIVYYRDDLISVATFLKLHSLTRATNAIDASVVDHIGKELRFNLFYLLQSCNTNTKYVLATWASETLPAFSLQALYPAFNWAEREIWDMYGLFFVKHPDLRRILTDYGFVGHPLRKDFPLTGFKEVQYEDSVKQVEYSNAELAQSYRLLSFGRPWSTHEQKKEETF